MPGFDYADDDTADREDYEGVDLATYTVETDAPADYSPAAGAWIKARLTTEQLDEVRGARPTDSWCAGGVTAKVRDILAA